MGHTNATKHKIVLKDLDTPPFKECFCRILPPQLDEVREHLKLMLDAGVALGAMLLFWLERRTHRSASASTSEG